MNRKRNLPQLDLYENNIFHFYTVALFAGHTAHESVSEFYLEFFLLLNMLTENFQISKFHHYYLFKVLQKHTVYVAHHYECKGKIMQEIYKFKPIWIGFAI